MSTPQLPQPQRIPRKGPNPLLFAGIVVLGTLSFFALADNRTGKTVSKSKQFASPLTPPMDAEKVEQMARRRVE